MADEWEYLRLMSINRGDHADVVDIRSVLREKRVHIACLQEMMSVQNILAELEDSGWKVWRGNRESSEAAPVVWRPEMFRVEARDSYPLLPADTRAGKRNMAKTLNIVRGNFRLANRTLSVGCIHNIQTQQPPERAKAAENFVERVVEVADRRIGPVIVAGDWNAVYHGPSLQPMRKAHGWVCDQDALVALDTGPHHTPIDQAWHRDRENEPGVLRLDSHRTVEVDGTDHKGLLVIYRVRKV